MMEQLTLGPVDASGERESSPPELGSPGTAPKRGQQAGQCPKQKVQTDVLFIVMIILEFLIYMVEERPFLSRLFCVLVVAIIVGKLTSWLVSTFCHRPGDENSNLSFIDIHQNSCTPPPSSIDGANPANHNLPMSDNISSPVLSEGIYSSGDLPPYHIALSLPRPSDSVINIQEHSETPPPTYDNALENQIN